MFPAAAFYGSECVLLVQIATQVFPVLPHRWWVVALDRRPAAIGFRSMVFSCLRMEPMAPAREEVG